MGWIGLVAVLLLMVLAALVLKRKPPAFAPTDYPYQKQSALFTPAERSFLGVLDQLLGDQYRVMGKMRVADVVTVAPMHDRKRWQKAFNRISAKHFDFILCHPHDLSPRAVIELDDRSHSAARRRQRDEFLEGVCEAAGLLLLRVPARQAYTRSDLQRLVANRLVPQVEEQPAGAADQTDEAPADERLPPGGGSPECPKCASSMVLRRIKRGRRAGQTLWGCSRFPACRAARPASNRAKADAECASDVALQG